MGKDSFHQTMIDVPSESVSDAVIELVESIDEREMEELPVLYGTVDVDAINELCTPGGSGANRDFECTVSFCYADYEIHIDSIPSQGTLIRLVAEENEGTQSVN